MAQLIRSPGEIEGIPSAKRKKLQEESEQLALGAPTTLGLDKNQILAQLHETLEQSPTQNNQLIDPPPEIWLSILSFVPSYLRFGLKKISSVCEAWRSLVWALPSAQFDELLRDSLADGGKGAIYLLAHKSASANLTHAQIMSLCGAHKEFANLILADEAVLDFWTEEDLSILSQHHEEIARTIKATPALYSRCATMWHLIGDTHLDVVKETIAYYKKTRTIDLDKIIAIARNHAETAVDILKEEGENLAGDEILELCSEHPEAGEYVLNTPSLMDILESYQLAELTSTSDNLALEVLQKHVDRLEDEDIVAIISDSKEAALYVINTPSLLARMSAYDIAMIGFHHASLIQTIWERPDLLKMLSIHDLVHFGKDPSVAMHILDKFKDKQFYAKLKANEDGNDNSIGYLLAILGRHDLDVASSILDNLQWREELLGSDLSLLANYSVDIAMRIIKDASLCRKMDGHNLASIGSEHEAVALYILNTPELVERLSASNLNSMGLKHRAAAITILKREELVRKLDVHTLAYYSDRHVGISTLIQNTAHLKVMIKRNPTDEMNVQALENKRCLLSHIQEKAYQFYKEFHGEDLYPETPEKAQASPRPSV